MEREEGEGGRKGGEQEREMEGREEKREREGGREEGAVLTPKVSECVDGEF